MNTNLTELVFILDRSGSMGGLESDTIGGFNSMLAKQQAQPGECRMTTVLFDDKYEILHDRIDISAIRPLTANEYYVQGTTALLDAIGKTIKKIGNVQKNTSKKHRAGKVLFIITTDGMENASREFSYSKIKSMVEHQKSKHGWEFIFLGANIDAIDVAKHIGIAKNRSQSFVNDSVGIALNYNALSETICSYRASSDGEMAILDNWNSKIDKDYQKRKDASARI